MCALCLVEAVVWWVWLQTGWGVKGPAIATASMLTIAVHSHRHHHENCHYSTSNYREDNNTDGIKDIQCTNNNESWGRMALLYHLKEIEERTSLQNTTSFAYRFLRLKILSLAIGTHLPGPIGLPDSPWVLSE